MKKIIASVCILLILAIFLSACGVYDFANENNPQNSRINPRDLSDRHVPNIVMIYSGYWWGPTNVYPMPTRRQLLDMAEVGMNEFLIITGPPAMSYYDDEGVRHPIVTYDDIDTIEPWKTSAYRYPEGGQRTGRHNHMINIMKGMYERYQTGAEGAPDYFEITANSVLEHQIRAAERILEHIPDARLWFTFPTVRIYSMALNFYEPFTNIIYNGIKEHFAGEVWENNIMGFYFADEEVSYYMMHFDYENEVDFGNPMVRLMLQLSRRVRADDKKMLWLPFSAPRGLSEVSPGVSHSRVSRIGHIANRTDIFDYVLMQPNFLFYNETAMNLEAARMSTELNTVVDSGGNIIGGSKISSTSIGVVIELEENEFQNGNPRPAHSMTAEESLGRFRGYYDNFRDLLLTDNYPRAFCASEMRSMHGRLTWPRLILFFDENAQYPD